MSVILFSIRPFKICTQLPHNLNSPSNLLDPNDAFGYIDTVYKKRTVILIFFSFNIQQATLHRSLTLKDMKFYNGVNRVQLILYFCIFIFM